MSTHTVKPHLTDDQVFELNDKHGWFKFGDSQGDVSKAFAQDAIEMHKRTQDAAPDLLAALENLYTAYYSAMSSEFDFPGNPWTPERDGGDSYALAARAAIAKATGGTS